MNEIKVTVKIMNNDTIWDCEQEAYHRVIETYLKERGLK